MDTNITSIGEILWDVYPDRKRLGGAPFNFIYHVWKISGNGNFVSSVGNDENGMEILDFLKSRGFPTGFISIDAEHPTGTVQVKLLEDKTPQFKISEECSYDFVTLRESDRKTIIERSDLVYFGTLSQRSRVTRSTIRSLFGKNIKYFCDLNLRHDFFSKEMIREALDVSNVIKINLDELNKIKNMFGITKDDKESVKQLTTEYNIDLICVTLGEKGALLYNGKDFDVNKTESPNIVDTVGAGDAYASILCLGFLKNMDIIKINKLANEFASDICGVEGAVPNDDTIYNKYIREFENDG